MVEKNSGTSPEPPVSVQLDGGTVILEETTPIRLEMIHRKLKVITQKGWVFIGVYLALYWIEWT